MSEEKLLNIIADEFETAKRNQQDAFEEYQAFIDLLDAERGEKDYDWMSDIRLPEFASHMLTQSAIDVDQYFQTRDFVEAYTEDEGDEAKENAAAAKELINRTLNQKHLHHYLKYVRAKNINHLNGFVYAMCWWEHETRQGVIGSEVVATPTEDGELIAEQRPVMGSILIKDRFNYEPIDPRNVFTDNKYVYSVQDKDYIFIRTEKKLSDLEADQERMGYFGLDKLGKPPIETETSKETYNKDEEHQRDRNQNYDVLDRYGKMWCLVKEKDESGYPLAVENGLDGEGNPKDGAELHEVIATFALTGTQKHLIGFRPTWAQDAYGNPYKPIIRGLCYVHPTKDSGVGDGKYAREIQIAIDDTFNMSNDRTQLATMPVMKGKRHSMEDNSTVYFEPGHVIELNDTDDLKEMQVSDNVNGALQQLQLLTGKMQQVTSIYPTTMGSLPGMSSTTATAVAGAEQRTNIRTNYKGMTFENTFLVDLYWMIQHMTFVFAQPETAMKLMGDKVYAFNPARDYYYKPVSQAIESEQSKTVKVQRWTQVLGYITQVQHPDTIKLVNYILGQIFTFMGDEYVNFAKSLLDPAKQMEGAAGQLPALGAPTSNQSGVAQSGTEQMARGMFNA